MTAATTSAATPDLRPALGLVLPIGPTPGDPAQVLADVDALLDRLDPHVEDLWVTDHLQWDDDPTLEAWTTLSFAAARWPDLGLGTVVLGQSYRNPGLLSKMASTLQVLSGGRLVLGVGAGWKRDEYDAHNYPFPSGGTRVDELGDTLEILAASWDVDGPVTVAGEHHQVSQAHFVPRPEPRPPLLVGGGGDRTLRLVARHANWWNLPDCSVDHYADRVDELRVACDEIDRDANDIRLGWFGRLGIAASLEGAIGLSAGRWTPDNAIVGTPEQVADRMSEFGALGVDHFALEVLTEPQASGSHRASDLAIDTIRSIFRPRAKA